MSRIWMRLVFHFWGYGLRKIFSYRCYPSYIFSILVHLVLALSFFIFILDRSARFPGYRKAERDSVDRIRKGLQNKGESADLRTNWSW